MKQLTLEIHAVKCVDETGGSLQESIGGDEIALSGVTIDANGRVSPLRRLGIGSFERDGIEKRFKPAKALATFDLTNGPEFPRLYQTVMILAERDSSGGLDEHVKKVAEETSGAASKSSAKADGGLTALGIAAATKLGEIALKEAQKAIDEALKDDIFPGVLEKVEIKTPTFRFTGGSLTSRPQTVTVKAANGTYEITHGWRLVD